MFSCQCSTSSPLPSLVWPSSLSTSSHKEAPFSREIERLALVQKLYHLPKRKLCHLPPPAQQEVSSQADHTPCNIRGDLQRATKLSHSLPRFMTLHIGCSCGLHWPQGSDLALWKESHLQRKRVARVWFASVNIQHSIIPFFRILDSDWPIMPSGLSGD